MKTLTSKVAVAALGFCAAVTAAESLPTKMKVIAIDAPGGPEVMTLRTLPVPTVDADDVLIEVHVAGVAVWDLQIRKSMRWVKPRFPYVMGSDGSGVVVAERALSKVTHLSCL